MEKSERVSVKETAAILGVARQEVREKMKRGTWKIGYAYPPNETGKTRWDYHIYRTMLDKHLGKEG